MPSSARRYVPLALPLLCAGLLMTGCGGKQEPSAAPTAVTTLGEQSPSPTPTPKAPASPSKAAPPTTPPAATYPSAAKAYAEAVIAAWKAKNLSRLGDLTTPQVQEQIMEIPGPPNMNWSYVRCDGAMGSSYCEFTNADGDKLTLRVTNEKLGQPHAVGTVKFE